MRKKKLKEGIKFWRSNSKSRQSFTHFSVCFLEVNQRPLFLVLVTIIKRLQNMGIADGKVEQEPEDIMVPLSGLPSHVVT